MIKLLNHVGPNIGRRQKVPDLETDLCSNGREAETAAGVPSEEILARMMSLESKVEDIAQVQGRILDLQSQVLTRILDSLTGEQQGRVPVPNSILPKSRDVSPAPNSRRERGFDL